MFQAVGKKAPFSSSCHNRNKMCIRFNAMDRDNKTLYIRPFFYFFFPFFLFCVCLQLMSSAPFVYTNRISRGFSAIHMAWIFPPRIGRGIPAGRRKKKLFLNNNNTQNKGERTSRLRREALWCFSFFKKGIPLDNVLTSRKPLYSLYFLRWVREKKNEIEGIIVLVTLR